MSQTNGARIPPHDLDAERALLGSMLLSRESIAAVHSVTPADFYRPVHGAIYNQIVDLYLLDEPVDLITLTNRLGSTLDPHGGQDYLYDLIKATPASVNAPAYARIVTHASRQRRLITLAGELGEAAYTDHPWNQHLDQLEQLATHGAGDNQTSPNIDEFLAEPETEHDWIVPGVLERGDRLILTGPEGHGKSTLLRQLGVQIAAGLHPFKGHPIDPQDVLIIDVENSARQIRKKIRPLRQSAGYDLDPDRLHIECRPQGIDLNDPSELAWFADCIRANQPDLLITGPIYKLISGNPIDEEPARHVSAMFDRLRVANGCALLLEAHQPHATGAGKTRPLRPYGASLWMRWPEFGLNISEHGTLAHWRGGRDERDWPPALKRGGDWPWTPITDPRAVSYARMVDHVRQLGHAPSNREIAKHLEMSEATVRRAISANADQWEAVLASLGEGPE